MNLYINLLKSCLLDDVYGHQKRINRDGVEVAKALPAEVESGRYWPNRAHTMIGRKRLDNIQYCMETCLKEGIPGDFIETGVWRGGATILMRGILAAHNIKNRKVYVADSFEGLPPPDPKYAADVGDSHHNIGMLAVSLDEVKGNFRRYNLLDDQVVFIKGFFETSLTQVDTPELAVLRLDGDMYSSTIQVLNQLFDKVSPGGFIIVDDWTLAGARAAVIDFRKERSITSPIIDIDGMGAYWRNN